MPTSWSLAPLPTLCASVSDPKGMDKIISTFLKKMQVVHTTSKMLVELSKSQGSAAENPVADNNSTTVVVIAEALLEQCLQLSHGIHPTVISDSLHKTVIKSANTSLNRKVVSQYFTFLAPLAVEVILSAVDAVKPDMVYFFLT
ncbi:hypothetical protein V8G54_000318 [Vigna mungo]|uniref:Uncharacterized protein n=1 Tax=Vigna mungo TaxID=3915 RepID=A0AAQ3S765_VIGMU